VVQPDPNVENISGFGHGAVMNGLPVLILLVALVIGGGCQKPDQPAPAAGGPLALPAAAQGKLRTMRVWLGAEELETELALTPREQQIGMMFRTNMAENTGMLFPLPVTDRASFWMKNCPLPLSAAYINPDGVIQEIHDFQPHNTNAVISVSDRIRFVLETPQGWFERHHVGAGAVVRTERGPLMETFFKR
jgi:uncharacterized membrane protein (UPF0127 family)